MSIFLVYIRYYPTTLGYFLLRHFVSLYENVLTGRDVEATYLEKYLRCNAYQGRGLAPPSSPQVNNIRSPSPHI